MTLASRYRHFQLLAEGGLCEVWKGVEPTLSSEPMVLKRLRPALAGFDEAAVFFRNEIRFHRLVSEDSFLLVAQDSSLEEGREYLVLPFFRGLSFQQWLQRFPSTPLEIRCHWAAQAISKMADFHALCSAEGESLEAVHHDPAPQNWLVSQEQDVTLIDFGLTRFQGMSEVWEPDALLGRLGYLPPEAFAGEKPTQVLDWYSLGVTLWELLAGERLFGPPPPRMPLEKLAERQPRSLREERPELPETLTTLVDEWLNAPAAKRREVAFSALSVLQQESDDWRERSEVWLTSLAALESPLVETTVLNTTDE